VAVAALEVALCEFAELLALLGGCSVEAPSEVIGGEADDRRPADSERASQVGKAGVAWRLSGVA